MGERWRGSHSHHLSTAGETVLRLPACRGAGGGGRKAGQDGYIIFRSQYKMKRRVSLFKN